PARPAPPVPGAALYFGGTFLQQAANNAVNVTLPLAIYAVTGSLASAAVVVALAGWADAMGTMAGGWLAGRMHPMSMLTGVSVTRAAALAAVPLLIAAGHLTLPLAAAAYAADSFARGVADTARNTLPVYFVGRERGALERFNGRFQSFFESGAVAGPFLVGGLMSLAGAAAGQWLAPAAVAAAALAFTAAPKAAAPEGMPTGKKGVSRSGLKAAWTYLRSHPAAATAFAGLTALTLYPLRAVLPAVYAQGVLGDPSATAWLVGMFGVGGVLGSLAFRAWHGRLKPGGWVALSAVGTGLLATAWLPHSFLLLAAGIVAFAALNMGGRLTLNSTLQASAPPELTGAVMGSARFSVNLAAMGVKAAVAAALAVAAGSPQALALVTGGMALFGGVQVWTARRLAKEPAGVLAPLGKPSPVHGLPGRLIVVEGLDGSGKSTQLELLRDRLEAQGREVVVTRWNSSPLVSDSVRASKKDADVTPKAFALAQAADLADRVENVVLPALAAGKVVLADRWFFTGLARDEVRGSDRRWLKRLYAFAPEPDLALYYRAPVETAVGRVLRRGEGKLSLSEDHEDEDGEAGPHVKYYEGGLDLHLDADPVRNFLEFQRRVTAVYDAAARAYRMKVLPADRGVAETALATNGAVDAALGDVPAVPERTNLFDKDPKGDAENIRDNYRSEKRGLHFYFRNMLLPMQARFAELVDVKDMPRVFLHGNPHIDNYAKTNRGAALADFDRSREGPYAWDLVRFMVSLSLRQKTPHHKLLPKSVLKALQG
ncbi:MAG: MFS transporter, partial [Elusimicrobia bacterium]|nr:MFS transporter [Elusimicrobiota bacterium]